MRNPSSRAAQSDKKHHDSLYPFRKIFISICTLSVLAYALYYKSTYDNFSNTSNMSEAAYIPEAKAPIVVEKTEIPTLKDNEILIKNEAIPLQPIDAKQARIGFIPLKYPAVLGSGVAGTVVESKNPNFNKGDRVLSHTPAYGAGDNKYGAFQKYTVGTDLTLKLPDNVTFEKAASLAVNVPVAYSSLFVGLSLPKTAPSNSAPVLIWGGSTSVGGYAIQLAIKAGYAVVTTASAHNHAYVKSLGVEKVYTYDQAKEIAAQGPFAGILDNAGTGASHAAIWRVLQELQGKKEVEGTILSLLPSMAPIEGWPASLVIKFFTFNFSDDTAKEERQYFWAPGGYYSKVVAEGIIETPVEVRSGGLKEVEKAVEDLFQGVSAKKLVITGL
ncbi:GroES-like protein [Choiromyces venosus 120613-1]|uniref:GroES-like protein n=1 Tax=Choiromyces venosus 120613-1 TaxID=1336337 RepID=A0A3N4JRU0_9PEZI|nr:GroES-like protein [Choiromyces venosus 120613-1]